MCEFKVFLDGEKVAEDVIYAKEDRGRVTLRDVIGRPVVLDSAKIVEVDVVSTRLILAHTQ